MVMRLNGKQMKMAVSKAQEEKTPIFVYLTRLHRLQTDEAVTYPNNDG